MSPRSRTLVWSVLLCTLGVAAVWLALPRTGSDPGIEAAGEGDATRTEESDAGVWNAVTPTTRAATAAEAENQPGEAWLDTTLTARVSITAEVRDLLTNAPIAGATVRGEAPVPVAETGADGRFSVRASAGRPLSLLVGAEGRTWVEFKMVVEAADSTKVFPIRLPSGVTLSGVVRDVGGRPLPGAQVSVTSGGRKPQAGETGATPLPKLPAFTRVPNVPDFRGTVSDADGSFRLPGMLGEPGGTVRVRASLPGYRAALSEPVLLDPQRAVEPIVLTLRRGATLYGRVLLEDQPVAAQLLARFEGKVGNREDLRTEDDGRFVLADLPPGSIQLVARVASNQLLRDSVAVQVTEGQVVAVDVRIRDRVGLLAGRATDESGAPVAGARVFLAAIHAEFSGSLANHDALTAADGSWRIEQPWDPDAVHEVGCTHGGVVKQLRGIRQGAANVDFVLPVTGLLFLEVIDARSGQSHGSPTARWTNPTTGDSGRALSEQPGRRTRSPGTREPHRLPVGVLDLDIDLGGGTFPMHVRGVTVTTGPGQPLRVTVNDGTKVVLTCRDNPELLRSAQLELVATEPDAPRWRRGAFGRARTERLLHGVPAGTWRVVSAQPGVDVDCAPFLVNGEAELTVPIVVRRKH